jgi:hypothetical protein
MITEIPDPFFSKYQLVSGGDVLAAAGHDFEHLLRTVVNLPPESLSLTIKFVFTPKTKDGNTQSRLTTYIMARAYDESIEESLKILLERGPINRFYNLKRIEQLKVPRDRCKATCEIIRRESAVEPLYIRELNVNIPDYYYTVQSFEPNNSNDYVDLDGILSGIRENVIIIMRIEPTDVGNELSEHTRYLSQLQSVNRDWERDQEDETEIQDYIGDNSSFWRSAWRQGIKPLRYQDPLADDILRNQQRFHESLQQPHLKFHMRVLAQTQPVAQLIGSVVAESAFVNGSYRLLLSTKSSGATEKNPHNVKNNHVLPMSGHGFDSQGKDLNLYSGLARLPHVATVDELIGAFRLPVASITSPACIRKNTDPFPEKGQRRIVFGYDQETFSKDQEVLLGGQSRGINLKQLSKHVFVSGVPGSTKTTNMQNLTLQLYQYGIPFLVIEPVKTEYRQMKTLRNHTDKNAHYLAKALEIYTLGDETISPFRWNPLWVRPGISVDEHIDNILACFRASMPVSGGPLPALLGEGLERVYKDHPNKDDPPIMSDVVVAVGHVLEEKGYSADTNSDIRSALEVRLGVLVRRTVGKIFQCKKSIPSIDQLMKVPSVLELDSVNQEQACLLILFILMSIREYLKTVPKIGKDPRFVIIFEEAHNLVGRDSEASYSPDVADPKAFAAEYICRMLAELRALGVGIVIVDQFPSKVAPEVIKSTATKLSFRQVAKEDREDLGGSMLFENVEFEEIARFLPGEAFLYTETFHRPRRIKTENLHDRYDLNVDVLNRNIIPYLQDDPWYQDAINKRAFNDLILLKEKMGLFNDERLEINQKIVGLLAKLPQTIAQPRTENTATILKKLKKESEEFERRLSDLYESFLKNSYNKYLNNNVNFQVKDSLVLKMKDDLTHHVESIIEPDVNQCLEIINEFKRRCKRYIHKEGGPWQDEKTY